MREKVSFHRRRQTFRRLVCESRRGSVGTLANVGDASPVVERGGSKDIESVAGNADSAAIKVGTPHFKEGTFEPAAKRRRSPLKACGALVSASQASVRKVFMRRSRLAGWLCMGGLGEVFLIFGYLAANLTLVFVHSKCSLCLLSVRQSTQRSEKR